MAKKSRTEGAPLSGAVSVVKGSITTTDDPTALDVKLSIWATEITMRADGAELGNWPADAVVIRPLDAFSFEFIAEGDRLIFAPDNPDEFTNHPIVAGGTSKKRRRGRRAKKKSADVPATLRWDETTDAEAELRKKQAERGRRRDEIDQPKTKQKKAKKAKPAKPSRSARRAAGKAPAESAADPPPEHDEWIDQFGAVETPRRVDPDPVAAARTAAVSNGAAAPEPRGETLRHRTWIRAIDFARQYDLFGLDRVQVSEELRREPTHDHTWNHRVAPTSGPGKYICTICGAIRRDS